MEAQVESQICTKCKTEKHFSEYHKRSASEGRFHKACKECRSKARKVWYREQSPLDRQARNLAVGILNRTSGRISREQYYNKGIECHIGKNSQEVANYLKEHFAEDIQAILDRGEQVSIDRIDPKKHYEHGNLQIITPMENMKRGGETTQKLFGQAMIIEDLETGEITKVPSKTATAKIIGCTYPAINNHLKRNSAPIFGRYKIKRESE